MQNRYIYNLNIAPQLQFDPYYVNSRTLFRMKFFETYLGRYVPTITLETTHWNGTYLQYYSVSDFRPVA